MNKITIAKRNTGIPKGKWCMQPYADGDEDYICRHMNQNYDVTTCDKYCWKLKTRVTNKKGCTYWDTPNIFIYKCDKCKNISLKKRKRG